MNLPVMPIRPWLLAGLILAPLFGGCGGPKTKPAEAPARGAGAVNAGPDAPAPDKSNTDPKPEPEVEKGGPSVKPKPDPKIVMGGPGGEPKGEPVPVPPKPLSADELQALSEWRQVAAWRWEDKPDFKRQRPVALIVLRPEGTKFKHTIPTALSYAGGLANASWDVKILLHVMGNDRIDLDALEDIRKRLKTINDALAVRSSSEEKLLPADVAPLRPIGDPVGFGSAEDLERAIRLWLGASFLGGHQFGPPARAPFGAISFSGHGQSVPDAQGNPKSLQFQVTSKEWFDLAVLEGLALRDYQAPIWVMTDMCRGQEQVKGVDPAAPKGQPMNLTARAFKNLENLKALSPADRQAVAACEALRPQTTAGALRHGTGLTALNTTDKWGVVVHKVENLLHHHCGVLLEPKAPANADDVVRPQFKNVSGNKFTLAEVHAWAKEQYKGGQRPGLAPGALSEWVVVYSSLRGKDVYPPQFLDVLAGKVSLAGGGFTVPELDEEPEHGGPINVIRKQKDNTNLDFKAIFKFEQPFRLAAGVKYRLALRVSASGPAAAKEIKFTTGVYTPANQLLNSSFVAYGESEAFKKPVQCDGKTRLISVPLTQAKGAADNPDEVSGFEIQAIPLGAETNWPQDAVLSVHAAYLVPAAVTDEQLKKDAERPVGASPLTRMCVWDVPLHETKPEAVTIQPQESGVKLAQAVAGHAGRWGAAGAVFPKLFVDPGAQQLSVKLQAAGAVADKAVVCVYVCTPDRVLAAKTMKLSEALKGQVIPIADSGLVSEVALVVQDHPGPVTITKLELENAPGGK